MKILQKCVDMKFRVRCGKCRSLIEYDKDEIIVENGPLRFAGSYVEFKCPACNELSKTPYQPDCEVLSIMDDGTVLEENY